MYWGEVGSRGREEGGISHAARTSPPLHAALPPPLPCPLCPAAPATRRPRTGVSTGRGLHAHPASVAPALPLGT